MIKNRFQANNIKIYDSLAFILFRYAFYETSYNSHPNICTNVYMKEYVCLSAQKKQDK